MKIKFILLTALVMSMTIVKAQNVDIKHNPLVQEWKTPHQTPPFDKIKEEHFLPAFKYAIEQGRKEMQAIIENKNAPTFRNTIEAMEYSGALLSRISRVFFNLREAETSPQIQEIAKEVLPLITNYSNDITLNPVLFERVKAVYNGNEKLTTEQQRLLEKTYKSFVRKGANLSESDKETYRKLTTELSQLTLSFGENVRNATNDFTLHLTEEHNVKGIPVGDLEIAADKAKSKGLTGWVFDLSFPSYSALLKYADDRDLRHKMFIEYNTRAFGGKFDNQQNVLNIVTCRDQLARLLGYKTWADYVLEERMAENPANVMNFLNDLLNASMPFAQKEVQEVSDYAKKMELQSELQRWDWSYYSEKLKTEKFNINDEVLKPYFKLENVINGVFDLVTKLFKIKFVAAKDIPTYHKDVKVYEVKNEKNTVIAVLYMDFHPRATKRNGAWMTSFRQQHRTLDGKNVIPLVQLVMNFTPSTSTEPSLLTFSEVNTFLHEFGHGLHGMLSDVQYESLSGTSVPRDFVELPSHFMENWATEKQFLDMFAKHYKTGKAIPASLIENIRAASNFQAGYSFCRQLTFGFLDMAWYSTDDISKVTEVLPFERAAIAKTELLPVVPNTCISTSFSHIFSGGYSAGYYGYKWAGVLEADAFSLFQERGIFDAKTAADFRFYILSKGGTENPMDLFVKFRGRKPEVRALLERSGLK